MLMRLSMNTLTVVVVSSMALARRQGANPEWTPGPGQGFGLPGAAAVAAQLVEQDNYPNPFARRCRTSCRRARAGSTAPRRRRRRACRGSRRRGGRRRRPGSRCCQRRRTGLVRRVIRHVQQGRRADRSAEAIRSARAASAGSQQPRPDRRERAAVAELMDSSSARAGPGRADDCVPPSGLAP